MQPVDPQLQAVFECEKIDGFEFTTLAQMQHYFHEAATDVLACTHTCLPFAQRFDCDGAPKALINNGSAGMPNFKHSRSARGITPLPRF
jgi:hypothetical protein